MEEELMHYRRPRTIFFTGSKDSVEFARKECHTVWYLGKNGINVHEGGAKEGIKVLDGGKSSLPQLGLLEDETGELTLSAEYWKARITSISRSKSRGRCVAKASEASN